MSAAAIARIVRTIKREKKFVILSHESPDGDAIGSQLALRAALKRIGKDVVLVSDRVPRKYQFLPGAGETAQGLDASMQGRIAIFVDTPTLERLGDGGGVGPIFKSIINIDHHVSNVRFGTYNWIDVSASSVGEMVFALIKRLGVEVDEDIGACLYVAILTDTGMFQYANTTRKTHAVVGEILDSGIDQFRIYQNVYENVPLAKLKLLNESLKTIKVDCGGKLVSMWITQDMFRRTGATMELSEDIINFARSVEGCIVAVVFKETQQKNTCRVSFRSKSKKVDVNRVAANFGGGGHKAASGCTVTGRREDVTRRVIDAIKRELRHDRA